MSVLDTASKRRSVTLGLPLPSHTSQAIGAPSHLFDSTCDVYSPTTSSDDNGAPTRTYSLTYSDVPCRVQPRSGNEPIWSGRTSGRTQYAIYVSSSYSISMEDRIVTGGKTLEITASVRFDMRGLVRLDCEEVL